MSAVYTLPAPRTMPELTHDRDEGGFAFMLALFGASALAAGLGVAAAILF